MLKHPVGLFREVQALEGLLTVPEERTWLEKAQPQPVPTQTVLYLGCNILRTPHLAQTVMALFHCLGEDFVAIGGAAFCCGVPYEREAGAEGARRRGQRLAYHLERYRPRQVVVWCPGCFHFCKEVLSLGDRFELLHVSQFLAGNIGRLSFPGHPAIRVALHHHCGSPDAEKQGAAARALLETVPGVEVVDVGSNSALGRSCSGNLRDRMGRQAWEAAITPYLDRAAAAGASIFATAYHGCQRMYAGYELEYPFAIEHYLTVVARALGIVYPDRYKQYLLWKDRDRILDDAQPRLQASRVRMSQAVAAVERVFVHDCGL